MAGASIMLVAAPSLCLESAMPKRRKKKIVRVIYQSLGPLPERLSAQFADYLLVFSDASQKRQGGLAAVIFDDHAGEPLIRTRSVPLMGSNELELLAALFALQEARQHFPGRRLALFSDNHDAVTRLSRAATLGLVQDHELEGICSSTLLEAASFHWVRGHANCRGNTLADLHAAVAAT